MMDHRLLCRRSYPKAEEPDVIASWWSVPRAVNHNGRTYATGVRSTGYATVGHMNCRTGAVQFCQLGPVYPDDHCTPSLLVPDDKPPIVAYAKHAQDNLVRLQRGQNIGRIDDLLSEETIDFGNLTSYATIFRQTGTDNLLLMTRVSGWHYTYSTDYGVNWSATAALFDTLGMGYVLCQQRGDVLNCVIYGHPTSSTQHDIYFCRINLATGDITTLDGTVLDNFLTPTGLPIVVTDCTLAYDTDTTGGYNVRLFDVSVCANPEIAFCEWTNDDDAVYRVVRWDGAAWTASTLVATGVVLGYTPNIHYHSGMSFPNPTSGGVVYLAREAAGVWYLERWQTEDHVNWTSVELERNTTKLARPYCPVGAGAYSVVYHRATLYTDYSHYLASMVGRA